MAHESLEVRPTSMARQVISPDGKTLTVPAGWSLLKPGDAALSRRIKKDGPTWTVVEKKGRKRFSQGIWAPTDRIETLRSELNQEREDPAYEKKLAAGRARRAREQEIYIGEFKAGVLAFLDFAPAHASLADRLAQAITDHAVPVGSGTVARTQRIPIEQRAEAATIAWMRHQTTAYDNMVIPREKGKRREIRRLLAKRSKQLLERYRRHPDEIDEDACPLSKALAKRA
ncbi:MAG: DUF2293 domain-containing protein [Verrucomicrobiae bacterium]|nr:DUF2293 domain-containing protein [Verrucomicrobiae bacterium]